ncbi:MAG: hypothetical protein ACK58T_14655, partial [Phycisphaerae bacterium]
MRALSQRGKLPGFEETAEGFKALAYGWVFDFDLVFRIDDSPGGCTLTPALVLKRRMPAPAATSCSRPCPVNRSATRSISGANANVTPCSPTSSHPPTKA